MVVLEGMDYHVHPALPPEDELETLNERELSLHIHDLVSRHFMFGWHWSSEVLFI